MNKDNLKFLSQWRSQCGTTLPPPPRQCIHQCIQCETKDIPDWELPRAISSMPKSSCVIPSKSIGNSAKRKWLRMGGFLRANSPRAAGREAKRREPVLFMRPGLFRDVAAVIVGIAVVIAARTAYAADPDSLDAAKQAFDRGDYATAVPILQKSADKGDGPPAEQSRPYVFGGSLGNKKSTRKL